jgi:hypothetical protein
MANTTPHLLPRGERLLQGAIADLLSDSATEIEVNNPPSVDELPTYFELDPSSDNPETIRVFDVSSNTIYFERGVYNSGVGREHLPNTPYKQKITSQHWKKVVDAVEQGYMPEDPSLTLVRDSATQFTVEGVDRTDYYIDGRVLRFNSSDANTATVESSVLSTGDTVVTLKTGSGTVPSPLNSVELSIQPRGYTHPLSNVTEMKNAIDGESATAVVSENGIVDHVKAFTPEWVDLTSASNATEIDWADGVNRKFRFTELDEDTTLTFTNPLEGQVIILRVPQDSTGGWTITWPSGISWAGGAAPDQAETLSTTDLYGFVCTDDTPASETFDGVVIATEMATP